MQHRSVLLLADGDSWFLDHGTATADELTGPLLAA